jgi:NADH:ubiquinone reductase (H+-translocating)
VDFSLGSAQLRTGATHSYFDRDIWAVAAPGLKTLEEAIEIRKRALVAHEAAEKESYPTAQQLG